jgi:hypothetical protein
MPQIITPPPADPQELASKNWYRAESLRKIKTDLINVYNEVEDASVRSEISDAIEFIEKARCILNPALRPVKKAKSK